MTNVVLYGLLWVTVVMLAVLPYLIAAMLFGGAESIRPQMKPLWPTFRLVCVFLGLTVFGFLGDILISNEAASGGMEFIGKASLAACITTGFFFSYRAYKIGGGEE